MVSSSYEFDKIFKHFRVSRNFSQTNLAERIGVRPSYISMIEKGIRRPPRELILKIGKVLNLSWKEYNKLLEAAGYHHLTESEYVASFSDKLPYLLVDQVKERKVRILKEEAEFQKEVEAREIWVISKCPLEYLYEEFFQTVKYNILYREITYVYYVHEASYITYLVRKLENEGVGSSVIKRYIKGILSPSLIFFSDLAIYDPFSPTRFGRIMSLPGVLWEMDSERVGYTYEKLLPVYEYLLKLNKERYEERGYWERI